VKGREKEIGEREVKWRGRKGRCIEEEEVGEGRRVEGRSRSRLWEKGGALERGRRREGSEK
jgi:hypothetical protein